MTSLLFALPGNDPMADRIATRIGMRCGSLESRRFPDDETYLRVLDDCAGRDVVLFCTLDRPDGKVLPLFFLADLVRQLGARSVGLAAPYLAYLRQDKRFQPGEAVTSRSFARLVSNYVDWIVTIDPHLHRYASLSDIYAIPAMVLHAAPVLSSWIASNVAEPLIVGPDEESEQWVSRVAAEIPAPYLVLTKKRRGDRDVEVSVPDLRAFGGCTPVVLDDIVSSARTMIRTVERLIAAGLRAPVCIGVHALFSADAERGLAVAGAGRVVTTNSVPHPTNDIDVTDLLAAAVTQRLG